MDAAQKSPNSGSTPKIDASARVVIVGSGLAGTAAALAASSQLDSSLEVIVLEKEPRTGGNSMKASSGINAVTPSHSDSQETFLEDTLSSGGGRSNPVLVEALVKDSTDALEWLASMGADLNGTVQLGGHSKRRTHFPPAGPSVGFAILKALGTAVGRTPSIKVITSATVVGLIKESEKVSGVRYIDADGREISLKAGAVVLASGGFGANRELLKTHAPHVADLATTNGPFAQGDGLSLASEVGASFIDLDQVQVHPTGFLDPSDPTSQTKFLAPEKLRGVGGVLLNSQGRRFVNELATRDIVSTAILNLPEKKAYLLLGSKAAMEFGPTLGFYVSKGLAKKVEGVEGAASVLGVSVSDLIGELEVYNEATKAGRDTFGKGVIPSDIDLQGDMYVAAVVPVIHYVMGGAEIDVHGQVLDENGQLIEGLFGAGEVTGGVHGKNRLGGNSLLECTVFGRRAGRAAAKVAAGSKL